MFSQVQCLPIVCVKSGRTTSRCRSGFESNLTIHSLDSSGLAIFSPMDREGDGAVSNSDFELSHLPPGSSKDQRWMAGR